MWMFGLQGSKNRDQERSQRWKKGSQPPCRSAMIHPDALTEPLPVATHRASFLHHAS